MPIHYVNAGDTAATIIVTDSALDAYNVQPFRDIVDRLISAGRYRIVVDLTSVRTMTSDGLGMLLGTAQKRTRLHGGDCVLVGVSAEVERVLRITGMSKVLPVAGSLDEAIALLTSQPVSTPHVEPERVERPSFWPPQVGDVWFSGIGDLIAPKTWVCYKLGQLCGVHDWDAEQVYRDHGPLRLVWRDGAVVTAGHASELTA